MMKNLKLGILGGGQLGTMLIRYAIDLGLNVSVLDKDPQSPARRYTSSFYCGDPDSYKAVMAFGQDLDIITIEREAVNTLALRDLQKKGVRVYPSPDVIDIIQDKFIQKKFLEGLDLPVVPGVPVAGREDLSEHAGRLPACLKKCRSGYDGHGVMMLREEADIAGAFDEPSVLEQVVDIAHEISVIVSRNEQGTIECYDPVLMIFDKERLVLDFQLCPAHITKDQALEACNYARRIADALQLVGILAVEMFITADGKVLINELAPRPHNSGHHTIEACTTSQYEQQLRAILGLPLGETKLNSSSVMINILEPAAARKKSMEEAIQTLLCMPAVHLHWYGKGAGREGRKMGHITITEKTIEDALSKAIMVKHILKPNSEHANSWDHNGKQF